MKVLLAPHGTRGDVQPILALGLALRGRGHEVAVAAPDDFGPWVRSSGLTFHPVGMDIEALLRQHREDVHKLGWEFRHLSRELIPLQFEALPDLCAGADVVVGAGLQFAAGSIAERLGIPYFTAVFCPAAIPSAWHPPPPVPPQTLPRWANRASWRLLGGVSNLLLRGALNRGRARLDLPPVDHPSRFIALQGTLLLAADPRLAPLPPDAPGNVVPTGAWVLEPDGPLAAELEAFLAAGPPPVYVGFGSMVTGRPEAVTRTVLDAAGRAGCRLLLHSGWTGLGERGERRDLPEWCHVLGPTPHPLLFPRLAAVVHHGGAGTTTAAARAGVPQIVLPHLLDQHYWAHRVQTLGLGPKAFRVHRLNAQQLAPLLRRVVEDPSFRERAAAFGREARERDGLEAGVEAVERAATPAG